MLKKLDTLIIKAFVGPFIATFFITVLVLVMQFFWLYIDDFVGKGLGTSIILEFVAYKSTELVPLALPLSVLLSSLMTFGNLGETSELIAIKAAGISLLRFMRPLFVVTIFICGIAFWFSNYIIPVANLKVRTLLADIVYAKPSFDLKEGVFYDKLSGLAIKIGEKEKNDSVIRNIIIYEQGINNLQDNFIAASDGIMRISENKRYLEFILKNGWRYEERGTQPGTGTELMRLGFKEYKREFDLSSFGLQQRTADSVNKNNARMLSMRQLGVVIDSFKKIDTQFYKKVHNEVLSMLQFSKYMDSAWKPDTIKIKGKKENFARFIPDSIKGLVNQKISNKISSLKVSNDVLLAQFEEQQKVLRIHRIEWHRKIAVSFACLVLFLIGAPLGAIIRKGGLGSPLVFAISFFVVFYFTSNTGEKFAKEGKLDVITGMWLSTIVLLPVGIFLTYKAMRDSQLFNKEIYATAGRKIKKLFTRNTSS